jgi:hypothetical protein
MSSTHSRIRVDTDDALELLIERLDPAPGTLRVEDLTEEFAWAARHRLVFGFDKQGRAAAVALCEDEPPLLLTGDAGLDALSEVLVRERGAIPGGLSPMELSEAVRRLTRENPSGFVGDAWRASPRPRAGFMDGIRALQEKRRDELSRSPVVYDLGEGAFRLDFFFWTPKGAVEAWVVEGDARRLRSARAWEVAPAGSFEWPFT